MSTTFVLYSYTPTAVGAAIFGAVFAIIVLGYIFIIYQSVSKVKLQTHGRLASIEEIGPNYYDKDIDEGTKRYQSGQYYLSKFKRHILPMFFPLIIGILMETIGYFARIPSHTDKQLLNPYIIQSVLLLIAPSFIAATIYMIFGRMMKLLEAEDYSIIKSKFHTTFFVIGDVLSFFIQSAGAGMMATSNDSELPKNLVIAGLIVQIVFFFIFIVSEVKFTYMANKNLLRKFNRGTISFIFGIIPRNWKTLNVSLILSSAFIFIRCIVRVIEFAEGFDGYIITHEAFIYLLDGFLIMILSLILLVLRPELILFDLMVLS